MARGHLKPFTALTNEGKHAQSRCFDIVVFALFCNKSSDMVSDEIRMSSEPSPPPCHVVVFNIGKKHNVGTIARCCTAFGVQSVCLVGSRQYNTFGSHGADAHVNFRHFDSLAACCARLRSAENCSIVGIEIVDDAQPVQAHPFSGPTAFLLGNEGQVSFGDRSHRENAS